MNFLKAFALALSIFASLPGNIAAAPDDPPRLADGSGKTEITGELKQWHKVTLILDGPLLRRRWKRLGHWGRLWDKMACPPFPR